MSADLSSVGGNDADIGQGHFAYVQSPDNVCHDGSLPRITQGVSSSHLRRGHAVSIQEQHPLLRGQHLLRLQQTNSAQACCQYMLCVTVHDVLKFPAKADMIQ